MAQQHEVSTWRMVASALVGRGSYGTIHGKPMKTLLELACKLPSQLEWRLMDVSIMLLIVIMFWNFGTWNSLQLWLRHFAVQVKWWRQSQGLRKCWGVSEWHWRAFVSSPSRIRSWLEIFRYPELFWYFLIRIGVSHFVVLAAVGLSQSILVFGTFQHSEVCSSNTRIIDHDSSLIHRNLSS
jgi:hypothetical protein